MSSREVGKAAKGLNERSSPPVNGGFIKSASAGTSVTSTKAVAKAKPKAKGRGHLKSSSAQHSNSSLFGITDVKRQGSRVAVSAKKVIRGKSKTKPRKEDKAKGKQKKDNNGSPTLDTSKKSQLDNYECPACGNFVPLNELVSFKGKAYHLDCYICSYCTKNLPRTEVARTKDDKFYCEECYQKFFKSRNFFASPSKLFPKSLTGRRGTNIRQTGLKSFGGSKKNVGGPSRGPSNSFSRQFGATFADLDDDDASQETDWGKEGFDFEPIVEQLKYLKNSYPEQAMSALCSDKMLEEMSRKRIDVQKDFYRCICSGLKMYNSRVGVYAMDVNDYEKFSSLFTPVIKKIQGIQSHIDLKVNTKNLATRYQQEFKQNFDLMLSFKDQNSLDSIEVSSAQFKFIRNVKKYPLTGKMRQHHRIEFERFLMKVFYRLAKIKYDGMTYVIDNKKDENENLEKAQVYKYGKMKWSQNTNKLNLQHVSVSEFHQLVGELDKFSRSSAKHKIDKYLKDTSIGKRWPRGSGVFVSGDRRFAVFYNHEDHLEIVHSESDNCTDLGAVYANLQDFMSTFERCMAVEDTEQPEYHVSERLGFITSCPTHLGAGFCPSVSLKLENLTEDGKISSLAKNLGFHYKTVDAKSLETQDSVQSRMNPVVRDDDVRIYPVRKVFETEEIILKKLFAAVPKILLEEEKADAV